jgi:hypothetical protein
VDSLRVCALINIFLIFRLGNYLGRHNSTFKKQKGKLLSLIDSSKIDITYSDDVDSDLISFFVSPVSEQPQPTRRNKVHALLDAGNFIAFAF